MSRRILALVLLALPLAAGTSCHRASDPVTPATQAPDPKATSAAGALQVLQWAVIKSRPDLLDDLLSADFQFIHTDLDSSGNLTRTTAPRDTLLAALRSMLGGIPGRSEPAKAQLDLDRNLIELPDARPGRDPRVHRGVLSWCRLNVHDVTSDRVFEITGYLQVYASRGDSVALPVGSPGTSDTSRWSITSIEDQTSAARGPRASAHPVSKLTLWLILDFFLARTRG